MTIYVIIIIALHVISWFGLAKIFEKAGVAGWKAFVPILNYSEWLKLIGKPQWWIALLFIPIVNIFYMSYMLIGLAKAFKHYDFFNHAAAVLFSYIYLPFLGFSNKEEYYGIDGLREGERLPEVGAARSWVDSIIFAVIAAHLIRMFFIEAYKIPTSSMEPTLQIGDFMFVSKANYGSRIPNTPLSLPLIHHTIPFTNSRAYTELIKLPYYRLPGFQKIKRNDIAVFNVPFEYDMQSPPATFYYRGIKYDGRPVDKREHYIKRVVGIPGDKLEIKNNQIYINDAIGENPELVQFKYLMKPTKMMTKPEWRELGFRAYNNYFDGSQNPEPSNRYRDYYEMAATPSMIKNVEGNPAIEDVRTREYTTAKPPEFTSFPKDAPAKGWSVQDYGPIIIPAKGLTIELTSDNYETYREAIAVHEHNDLEIKNGQFYINGEPTNEYTFNLDYYFMMGDNRHSSFDSRGWGFVPEDHIVGKPLFIFFSQQGGEGNPGIRWNRILKPAQDMN